MPLNQSAAAKYTAQYTRPDVIFQPNPMIIRDIHGFPPEQGHAPVGLLGGLSTGFLGELPGGFSTGFPSGLPGGFRRGLPSGLSPQLPGGLGVGSPVGSPPSSPLGSRWVPHWAPGGLLGGSPPPLRSSCEFGSVYDSGLCILQSPCVASPAGSGVVAVSPGRGETTSVRRRIPCPDGGRTDGRASAAVRSYRWPPSRQCHRRNTNARP